MSEQPTFKGGGGGWEGESDDARTVAGDQQDQMPPTIPIDDLDADGWPQPTTPGGGAEPTWPESPTPGRGIPIPDIRQPDADQAAGAPQTMLIGERPVPVFAWLAVMDGSQQGKIHTLQPDTTLIGREAGSNHVVMADDDACSAQHAKIRLEPTEDEEDEVFVLYDMASSNGTFVGTKQTYQDTESRTYRHELKDGDYILIGETTLVFKQIE